MPTAMSTPTKTDERTYDVRTVERKIRRGQISRKDLDKHMKSLPDAADKAVAIHVGEHGTGRR